MTDDSQRSGRPQTWPAIGRIAAKAAILFIAINLVFAVLTPMEVLGELSLYNWLLEGRERLPYGENTAESYNLSLNSIPAMMASHKISDSKAEDEFRVIIIGDSGTWGWLLENEDTLAGQINGGDYQTNDGRRIVAHNLGYPIMALSKDLLILEAAMAYEPDLILWPVTLESFPSDKQLVPPLVNRNPEQMRSLISEHNLSLDPDDPEFAEFGLLDETIVGRRRDLADLLRLQLYGFSWDTTGIDQVYPEEITLRRSDFEEDLSWGEIENPMQLTDEELSFEILAAGVALSGDVPLLIVNEPIFISQGENSDIRYNAWYPQWAYDQYRVLLAQNAAEQGWNYIDLWNSLDGHLFTDSPVHLNRSGTAELNELILPHLLSIANNR